VLLAGRTELQGFVPLDKSPEVLADRAKTAINDLGYTTSSAEAVFGLSPNNGYVQYLDDTVSSPHKWNKLRTGQPSGIEFWYRQAGRRFVPSDLWRVLPDDPPPTEPGMISAVLDTSGRLIAFNAVPSEPDTANTAPRDFDWSVPFTLAGLNLADFKASSTKWPPPVYSDSVQAWDGFLPNQPDVPVRVEASSYRGRLAHFYIKGPWDERAQSALSRPATNASQLLLFFLITVSLIGSAILARHNTRRGRGDLKGAMRLSGYVLCVYLFAWLLDSNHFPQSLQLIGYSPAIWMIPVGRALFTAVTIWLAYVALEPYLRHRWPHRIISWSRVLAGRLGDPLVGRDILIGAVSGALLLLVPYIRLLLPPGVVFPPTRPVLTRLQALMGFKPALGSLLEGHLSSITLGLGAMFLLLLFFMAVRKEVGAAILLGVIVGVLNVLGNYGPEPNVNWIFGLSTAAIMLFVLLRFGLLAFVMLEFFNQSLSFFPFTPDLNSWNSGVSQLTLLILAGLILYGFFTSLGGRQVFSSKVAIEHT
jgi:MFS family permease